MANTPSHSSGHFAYQNHLIPMESSDAEMRAPLIEQNKIRTVDKIATFFLGAFNNLPFVIGVASAKKVVLEYNQDNSIGLVFWANTVNGLFARFINTWLSQCNCIFSLRFYVNICFMLFGLLGCALIHNFWVTLVCIFFMGFSTNFGESTVLCYLTMRRKTDLLKAWSSGTGMAGIIGAAYSLICAMANVPYKWLFIGVSPTVFVVLVCYLVIRNSPNEDDPEDGQFTDTTSATITDEAEQVSMFRWKILKVNAWSIFNCAAVYFLEYVIQSGFADMCFEKERNEQYPYIFQLLNLMYQIGVFISRSSLSLFQFPKVWILTALQAVFWAIWCAQAYLHWMSFGVCIIAMLFVGLCGGCSYVNVFHLIMNQEGLTRKERELGTSWNAFFISLGIVLASMYTYIAQQTFMKKE